MVEVVVAFTKSSKSSDEMVTGSMTISIGGGTNPMGEGIDAESRMVDEHKTCSTCTGEKMVKDLIIIGDY